MQKYNFSRLLKAQIYNFSRLLVFFVANCSLLINIRAQAFNLTSCGKAFEMRSKVFHKVLFGGLAYFPTQIDKDFVELIFVNTGDTVAAITVAPTDETTYSVVGTNQYGCTSTASATVNVSQPGGQPCPGAATVTDADGNTYGTVQIGEQCWMKENLRTTHYADNAPIAQGSDTSSSVGYWYYPSNNSANATTLGLLYNWAALMRGAVSSDENPSDVQGICPAGWHVPSDAEWTELTDFVGSQSDYTCGGYSGNIAKSLASKTGWMNFSSNCAVGNNSADNNATGFGMLPAGYYSGNFNASTTAYCASATEYSENYVYNRNIGFFSATVTRGNFSKFTAVSVRCVRD